MKITILTLFPEMFEGFLTTSIIKKARLKGLAEIEAVDIREFTDDKHNRCLLYTSTVEYSGTEALKLIRDHKFDLAVLDVMLPDCSGFHLCEDCLLYTSRKTTALTASPSRWSAGATRSASSLPACCSVC